MQVLADLFSFWGFERATKKKGYLAEKNTPFAGRAVKRERRKGSSRRQQTAYGAAVNKVARTWATAQCALAEERKWRPKVHQARRDDRFSSQFLSLLLTAAIVVELLVLLLFAIVVELLVLLLCILTCKQVLSSSSIQGHLPWLRCSLDLVIHRPHRHHPFSLALRRRQPQLRLATSQPWSGLGVWRFSCSYNKTSSRRREERPQEVADCAVVIRDCMLLPSFVTTAVRHPCHVFVADDNQIGPLVCLLPTATQDQHHPQRRPSDGGPSARSASRYIERWVPVLFSWLWLHFYWLLTRWVSSQVFSFSTPVANVWKLKWSLFLDLG